MTRILFLTANNAVRAQMADAILRSRAPQHGEVQIAATDTRTIAPLIQIVLREIGNKVGIRTPGNLFELQAQPWDLVVTLAGEDEMPSPPVVGTRNERWPLRDPLSVPGLRPRLAALRSTRDSIGRHVDDLLRSQGRILAGTAPRPGGIDWLERDD